MNRSTLPMRVLLAATLSLWVATAAAQQTHYGDQPPAVDDIIRDLGAGNDPSPAVPTRALRPGAAVSATSATPPPIAPQAASISMQVNFDFNSDAISGSSAQTMRNLAAAMRSPALSSRTFRVVGHTDGKGSAAYNQALSERRAASVKRALVRDGVPAERLEADGRGKSELLNASDPNAAENRRVEIQASG